MMAHSSAHNPSGHAALGWPAGAAKRGFPGLGLLGGGLSQGTIAYLLWGLQPMYIALLEPSGAFEIIAHRIVWTALLSLGILLFTGHMADVRRAFSSARVMRMLTLSGFLLAFDLVVYAYCVTSNQVVNSALGSFINPLVSVLLGVVFLHERVRRLQWLACGIALLAVLVITIGFGHFPTLALALALSFGSYGLVKKKLGGEVSAMTGVAVESILCCVASVPYLIVIQALGRSQFLGHGPWHVVGLLAMGVVGVVPLALFNGATRRLSLVTMGILQYLSPILQFAVGVWIFHESMSVERWLGFILVWIALAVFVVDGLRVQHTLTHLRGLTHWR